MNEKQIQKIQREARRLIATGFAFHGELLLTGIDDGNVTAATRRVATMFERGARYGEARRVLDLLS